MTNAARLVLRGVACRRGERILFTDVDLALDAGELVWLRAANGFGKTTLLRAIAGLSKPEAGTISWSDKSGTANLRPRVPLLYLAHANALKDDLTVAESVRYLANLHALDASDAAATDAVRRVGLHGRRHAPVRTLSQGQRRRVALTRLCLSPPDATWLLDEPYDALDADGVALVGELLTAHARAGGNALFTSHVAPALDGAPPRAVQLDRTAASVGA